jgi:hypothetical protein
MSGMQFSIMAALMSLGHPSQVHKNRLAANKHNSTDPDATTVTVMFTKLPMAVENIGIERPAVRTDLALGTRVFPVRFFAAMMPR